MDGLSAAELADLAGTTVAEVQRLVDLGILVAHDGGGPLRASDVQRVRLVQACERAGLPLDGIAAAIREGRLSLVVLEGAPYRRWAVRSRRTCRQVSQDTGIPLEVLGGILESMGFARMAPDEPIREDELEEVVPLLRLARSLGNLDQVGLTRIGRAWAEGLRLAATVEKQDYPARFARLLESGSDRWTAMERAGDQRRHRGDRLHPHGRGRPAAAVAQLLPGDAAVGRARHLERSARLAHHPPGLPARPADR
jgi:adenylate cyclase